jgi:hypothetical protein
MSRTPGDSLLRWRYPISTLVNDPKNDLPDVILPLAAG